MRKETGFFVEGIPEIGAFGKRIDGFFRTGEKVPAAGSLGTAKMSHGHFFFLSGHLRSLAWVKADEDNFVIPTGIEGKHAKGADYSLLDLIAKHGATVVNERQDDGPLMEIIAELDSAARFVAECEIQRQPRIELRLETDVSEHRRHILRRGTGAIRHSLCACRAGAQQQRKNRINRTLAPHGLIFSSLPAAQLQPAILSSQ